jgi:hypothetical protein
VMAVAFIWWPCLVGRRVTDNPCFACRSRSALWLCCRKATVGSPNQTVYHDFMLGGWPLSVYVRTRIKRWRRSRVKRRYPELFDRVSALLFKFDPIGINFEDNTDEYDPEVGTILPRLVGCHSSTDARRVIFEEFCKWFGFETTGDEMKYGPIAEELWRLWCGHREDPPSGI